MLSEKAARILSALVHNRKIPLSAQRLAQLVEMSERSVVSYLKEVGRFCDENQIQYVSKPGIGVYLNIGHEQENQIASCIKKEKPRYTTEYRRWYIIGVLLTNWTSYTLGLFADDLNVSKATANLDLQHAKDWLAAYGIQVISKPGSGIAIEGNELGIRSALAVTNRAFYTPENTNQADLLSEYRLDWETGCRLVHTYKSSNLREYVNLIHLYEDSVEITLTGDSFVMVLEYLLVQAWRCRMGNYVEMLSVDFIDYLDISTTKEISKLLIEKKLLPNHEGEIKYLSLLFESADRQYTARHTKTNQNPFVSSLANKIIQYTSDLTGVDFKHDEMLQNSIISYLGPSLIRTYCGFQLSNPMIMQVKHTYPSIFSACYACGRFYSGFTNKYPTEDELSHLALLIGGAAYRARKEVTAVMVCAAGTGAAQLITMRLKEELPNLHILAILPFSQINSIKNYMPQIIISTSPSFHYEIETVYVSTVVNADDIRRLRRSCNDIYTKRDAAGNHTTLCQLLKPDLIFLQQSFSTVEKIIQFASDKLRKGNYVGEFFYQSTMEREQISSTALGKGIAIPHSTSCTVEKPAVCMIRLDKSIDWFGEAVDIVFVLALDFVDIGTTSAFFKAFYTIISDDKTVLNLRQASTVEEINKIIKERCEFE